MKSDYKFTNPKIFTKTDQIPRLPEEEIEDIKKTEEQFSFLSNEYYLSLIDWNDKNDPIRRIIIPAIDELDKRGV